MANPIPLLIISDSVSGPTGLGRIARELTVRVNDHLKDVCRVATLGCGGGGSRKLNFQQYNIEGMEDFVISNLPEAWDDWAGNEPGVILAIWDASRMGWFSRPQYECANPILRRFLTTGKFKRWIYAPVDAEGPNGKLTYPVAQKLIGFDRILAYSEWAKEGIDRTLDSSKAVDLDSIPHGIDNSVFYPHSKHFSRMNFFKITEANFLLGSSTTILEDDLLIGTIATNQSRKDWGLWAESCALFLARHPNARFWVHTDTLERAWSIPALLKDFGLMNRTVVSLGCIGDEQLAQAYSACDLTLGIGLGEGFGFPIFESLFCGTPCIHGNYGGAPEHIGKHLLVNPVAYRYEGVYCCKRPVFNAQDWADRMENLLNLERLGESTPPLNMTSSLAWTSVWPRFEAWFRKGLASL